MKAVKAQIKSAFEGWPTAMVSAALILVAIFLVVVALTPGNGVVKAATLAWVILP